MAGLALDRLQGLGAVFRSRDAIAAGLSWRDLYALRDAGDILELSRGLFQRASSAGGDHIDFVAVCARAPQGMIAMDSALAHWDLTDEIPTTVHLAVPSGSHRPAIDHPPTTVHVFASATFDLGRIDVGEPGGERFSITDRERTVVDAFRLRHQLGETTAHHALRRYLGQPDPRRTLLVDYATQLRAATAVRAAIRVLDA